MKTRCRTFTLIELLIVVAVIAVLAGITIGGAKFAFEKSQKSAIEMELKTLEMALEEYKRDWGYYPIWTNKNLLVGIEGASNALDQVLVGDVPVDEEEFEKDTTYKRIDDPTTTKDESKDDATSIGDSLYGQVKGDAWILDFDLNTPASEGSKPYLENDRSSFPFTQLKGARGVRYRYPGVKNPGKYDLLFPGHDEKFGTSDDINNWSEH